LDFVISGFISPVISVPCRSTGGAQLPGIPWRFQGPFTQWEGPLIQFPGGPLDLAFPDLRSRPFAGLPLGSFPDFSPGIPRGGSAFPGAHFPGGGLRTPGNLFRVCQQGPFPQGGVWGTPLSKYHSFHGWTPGYGRTTGEKLLLTRGHPTLVNPGVFSSGVIRFCFSRVASLSHFRGGRS